MKAKYICALLIILFSNIASAQTPLWTFNPQTATTVSVPVNTSATVLYTITNKSSKPHTLQMRPMTGVTQITLGTNVCGNPFTLSGKNASCTLSLQVNGYQLAGTINDGPDICEQDSFDQCYRPSRSDVLQITLAVPITLPAGCSYTANNNIQCEVTISGQTNYGFTNMPYALCRSAQCDYDGVQSSVSCSCQLIAGNQGLYSASVAPNDYASSQPVGNTVTSTYSTVNSSGESPTNCPSGPFANCFGATCVVNGSAVTCTCPVSITTYIAPQSNCVLAGKIWSATSTTSFPAIEGTMQFMYNTFFGGNSPI